jgi:hypothetical protein
MSDFVTPKTTWVSTDYINIEDYNRIKNNVQVIKDLCIQLYPSTYNYSGNYPLLYDVTYSTVPTPNLWATFISNLQNVNDFTFHWDIGYSYSDPPEFWEYGPYADFEDLNKLEGVCLLLGGNLLGEYNGRHKLKFKLNTKGGF